MKPLQGRKPFDLSFCKDNQHILQNEFGTSSTFSLHVFRIAQQKRKLIPINLHAVILESQKSLSVVFFILLIVVRTKRSNALSIPSATKS